MDLSQFDYEAARFWMSFLQILGLVALFVYTHITNKSKANASAINTVRGDMEATYDHLEERVVRCERRQDVFESRMDGAPTHQDLSKVYDRLNDVAEDLSGCSGQMRALSHQLSMVNSYLLNAKGDQSK
ncbi:uncharacterized protein DUF2730 [Marinobacter nauticus]|jgi:predicted  nucleic acid-binding Zn-ribbon protein|uniref:Uncharacterized protein DUF2730 n=1 Tax=Marinobacter nauticus TaxID=2743 RepID=A0A368X3P9_MARNT|nr:DUF2730 family protein [Marinobacter nauticus]RCW62620.1 uncharacterized protein DUF2730 [Marinobacter nauticus]